MLFEAIVVGVVKIETIAPRAGIEPTSLAFWASVPPRLSAVTTLPSTTHAVYDLPDYYPNLD